MAWGQGWLRCFSINYSAPAHTVHQSPAPPLPGPRVSFWWSTGDGQFTNTQTQGCKYLRVRVIVALDRCQDDMSWGQDISSGPRLISSSSPVPHASAVSLSRIPRNLFMTKVSKMTRKSWLERHLFSICFGYCLIICDVGHVEAVVLRGPRDLVGSRGCEARLLPAFVSISDTTSRNIFPTTKQRNNSVSIDFRWAERWRHW